jgi:valyl-tRNA synthetase
MTFEKNYNPKESESKIREFWDKEQIYTFDFKTKKPLFSIDTPPPTLSGRMHIGHAFSYTQQDFIARYKKMKGFEVFFPFGTDDNGLATEKLVQKEKGVDLRKVSRDEAVKIVSDYLKDARGPFIQDWKNIGMSCDFDLGYSTITNHCRKVSQKSFLDLVKKGLIARKEGPVMWDRVFQTSIAQAELEDLKRKAFLNYLKAKVKGSENTYMIFATTRPEMAFAVVGFSVEDSGDYVKLKVGEEYWITGAQTYEEKFKDFDYEFVEKLKGKDLMKERVIIPLVEKEIEITHDEAVKADFGTGIVYFCTYGGVEDIEWASRHNVDPVNLLGKDGRLNSLGQEFEGMLAEEARKEVALKMEKLGHSIMKEKIDQVVNIAERSGVEVEFIVSAQWYVTYLDKKEYFFEMAQKFNWSPEFMKHRLENWIKGLNWDWGFSRQRHFGIPIPAWYDKEGKIYYADESELPIDPMSSQPKHAPKNVELIPETDVFDTWFTSASTPFLAIELVEDEDLKKKLFPMDLRAQAHDIISFWLFYTMAKTNLLYDENPFKNVNISGWVLDPKGNKMSKSKGNVIAPQEVVDKFSNDALRFASASVKLGQDQAFMEKEVQTGLRVANKLYHANKFASMLLENFKGVDLKSVKLDPIDKWILDKFNECARDAEKAFDEFNYQKAKALYVEFFMNDVADNYLEIIKERLWQKRGNVEGAQHTLYTILYGALRGLAPFMPFITEEIYQNLYKDFEEEKSIHVTSYPECDKVFLDEKVRANGDTFISLVGAIRRYKAKQGISMKAEIEKIRVECEEEVKKFIEDSRDDLKAVTSVKEVSFGKAQSETTDSKLKVDIE